VAGQWFSPVYPTNKTDRHDVTEILLKVALYMMAPKFPWGDIQQHMQ
jgi:hypothetical protein